jgi:hypothetical protein
MLLGQESRSAHVFLHFSNTSKLDLYDYWMSDFIQSEIGNAQDVKERSLGMIGFFINRPCPALSSSLQSLE